MGMRQSRELLTKELSPKAIQKRTNKPNENATTAAGKPSSQNQQSSTAVSVKKTMW